METIRDFFAEVDGLWDLPIKVRLPLLRSAIKTDPRTDQMRAFVDNFHVVERDMIGKTKMKDRNTALTCHTVAKP